MDRIIRLYGNQLLALALNSLKSKLPATVFEGNSKFVLDTDIDTYYRKHLKSIFNNFIYLSEESNPFVVGNKKLEDVDRILIVDPLDTSEMAVRGLVGWTHLVVLDKPSGDILASIVGDFFHPLRIFYALKGKTGAYVRTCGGNVVMLHHSEEKSLRHALVTSFTMKPNERFLRLSMERALLNAISEKDEKGWRLGRIGLSFGSIGMCQVAAGVTDAFVEVAKGFQLWDLLPGLFILRQAGGVILDPEGSDVYSQLEFRSMDQISALMQTRKKFVASGTGELARQILASLRLNPRNAQ